jgi:hypothetical protein
VGFCDGQKWRWGRFSPRTSVSPANLHSICSPQSSSISPEAGTIGQEWPQCQESHKPNKKKLRYSVPRNKQNKMYFKNSYHESSILSCYMEEGGGLLDKSKKGWDCIWAIWTVAGGEGLTAPQMGHDRFLPHSSVILPFDATDTASVLILTTNK